MNEYDERDSMWSYRLTGPMQFAVLDTARPQVAEIPEGSVVLEFLTGGVCGSDIARCLEGGALHTPGPIGSSLHEIVGRVVASKSDLAVGDRVVGWVGRSVGLKQFSITEADALAVMDPDMDEVLAIPLQPLACVLHALTRLPEDLTGADVAIIGLGPIGLFFAHTLRDRGAASITGVDLVDRTAVQDTFGLDETEAIVSRRWSQRDANRNRFDVVIEAVGHQVGTLQDAIAVVAPEGTIVYFGNPDDQYYPIDFGQMMDKHVVLQTGRTPQNVRRRAMIRAQEYFGRYPDMFDQYITHVLPIDAAPKAYELAASPDPGRLKIILDARDQSAPQ